MRRRGRGQSVCAGFTLVEVLAGFGILALFVGGCVAALIHGYRMQETSRLSTVAAEVVQNDIENIRNMRWEQVAALPASSVLTVPSTFGPLASRFSGTRTITTIRANETVQIAFQIAWTSPGAQTHTRRISTYVSKNGRAYVNTTGVYHYISDDTEPLW